jgi:hypothetical protein
MVPEALPEQAGQRQNMMTIEGCPSCKGGGWLPKGCKGSRQSGRVGESLELCWCNQGRIVEGPPAFWKDRNSWPVFFRYQELEKAVSNFLNHIEPDPEQIKLLKFYLAQWLTKEPQPPLGWLERLAGCTDGKALNAYTTWLEAYLITPFGFEFDTVVEKLAAYFWRETKGANGKRGEADLDI